MQRVRFIFAAVLALAATSAYAAGTPTKVVSLDFSKTADQGKLLGQTVPAPVRDIRRQNHANGSFDRLSVDGHDVRDSNL